MALPTEPVDWIQTLDCAALGKQAKAFDCRGLRAGTFQFIRSATSAAFGATVLEVKVSNGDKKPVSFQSLPIAVTITADGGITDGLDLYLYRWWTLEVTTATASVNGTVHFHADPGIY